MVMIGNVLGKLPVKWIHFRGLHWDWNPNSKIHCALPNMLSQHQRSKQRKPSSTPRSWSHTSRFARSSFAVNGPPSDLQAGKTASNLKFSIHEGRYVLCKYEYIMLKKIDTQMFIEPAVVLNFVFPPQMSTVWQNSRPPTNSKHHLSSQFRCPKDPPFLLPLIMWRDIKTNGFWRMLWIFLGLNE